MRVRRSLWNFLSMLLLTAITMIVGIKSSPWLAEWLGDEPFGAVKAMNGAAGILTLLELGLSGALGPLMIRSIGVGDREGVHKAVVAGSRSYLRVSLSIILIGAALTPLAGWFAPDLNPKQVVDLQRAWLIGLGVFVPMLLIPLRSVIEAQQRGYIINLLLTGQSLLLTAIALVLAWANWGITGQSVALLTAVWTFNAVLASLVFRENPGLLTDCIRAKSDPETRKAMRGLSFPVLVINVCGRLSLLTDDLVISPALGRNE